jgi:hypothetical protein
MPEPFKCPNYRVSARDADGVGRCTTCGSPLWPDGSELTAAEITRRTNPVPGWRTDLKDTLMMIGVVLALPFIAGIIVLVVFAALGLIR